MPAPQPVPPAAVEEEFFMLMSMALDGLLDADEQMRLDDYVAAYPALAARWDEWQMLDGQLAALPHVAPPVNFMAHFETRLTQQERRRRLWWGFGFGALVALLAVGMVAGVSRVRRVRHVQPIRMAERIGARRCLWLGGAASVGRRAACAALAVAGAEQMRTLGLVYALVSAALLTGWVFFLRRTARPADSAQTA
ncbi:MAG: hypothetical protein R2838_21490 [Caldilineaceae bacterium]